MTIKHNVFAALLILLLPISILAHEPENIQTAKNNAAKYVLSGEYNADITHDMQIATQYLQQQITNNQTQKKLAVVLDIDETSISHFKRIRDTNFAATPKFLHDIFTYDHTPIKPVLKFYKFAIKNHITIFFITGRNRQYSEVTNKNLHLAGYNQFKQLFLTPHKYKSIATFKIATRKQITEQGYDIVLNIGDQYSDLKGGFAKKAIKLPNPFYYCG